MLTGRGGVGRTEREAGAHPGEVVGTLLPRHAGLGAGERLGLVRGDHRRRRAAPELNPAAPHAAAAPAAAVAASPVPAPAHHLGGAAVAPAPGPAVRAGTHPGPRAIPPVSPAGGVERRRGPVAAPRRHLRRQLQRRHGRPLPVVHRRRATHAHGRAAVPAVRTHRRLRRLVGKAHAPAACAAAVPAPVHPLRLPLPRRGDVSGLSRKGHPLGRRRGGPPAAGGAEAARVVRRRARVPDERAGLRSGGTRSQGG